MSSGARYELKDAEFKMTSVIDAPGTLRVEAVISGIAAVISVPMIPPSDWPM